MPQLHKEIERKFLIDPSEAERLGDLTYDGRLIDQYYLSDKDEAYELRVRRVLGGAHPLDASYTAAVKIGEPPERIEVETELSEEAFRFWAGRGYEAARKTRHRVVGALGDLTIDCYVDPSLWLAEIEGTVHAADLALLGLYAEVTRLPAFKARQLARPVAGVEAAAIPEKGTYQDALDHIRSVQNMLERPLVVAVGGASGSGKTTLAHAIAKDFDGAARVISMDDYYHGMSHMQAVHPEGGFSFDEPKAFDITRLAADVLALRDGNTVRLPRYDVLTWDRHAEETELPGCLPGEVIVVEGLYASTAEMYAAADVHIYAEAPLATRIGRRLTRDAVERPAIDPKDNLRLCLEIAEPAYEEHGAAQRYFADIVV